MKVPNNWNKKIILGLAVLLLIVIIPLIVTILVSFNVLNYIDTDNSWIGFWGSYLGAVMGGCITLYVLQKTIKVNNSNLNRTLAAEKEKLLEERKEKFCDEVCKMALQCSFDIKEYIIKTANGDQIDLETAKRILVICHMLSAKLRSKKNDLAYVKCDEFISATDEIINTINDIAYASCLGDENTAWGVIAYNFLKKAEFFDKIVKEFYIDNLSTLK